MWRFLVVAFAVMGWSFYELSGGSDYAPVENSIQVQGLADRALPKPQQDEPDTRRRTLAEVEAMMAELEQAEEETEDLVLTLVATDGLGIIEAEASRPKAELLQMELPERQEESDAAIEAAIAAAIGETTFEPSQLRWVKENIVELRSGPGLTFDKVLQVTKGTEVAVLEDPGHGWLNVQVIDTYQTGWLAEWLVTEPE